MRALRGFAEAIPVFTAEPGNRGLAALATMSERNARGTVVVPDT
jgi:CBS domain-containing protein